MDFVTKIRFYVIVLIVTGVGTWYFLKSCRDTLADMKKEKHKKKYLYELEN